MKLVRLAVVSATAVAALFVGGAGSASAATTTVSTPTSPAGWSVSNRPGGAGGFEPAVYSTDRPYAGNGSLKFTSDAETGTATYHLSSGLFSDATEASYWWNKASTVTYFAPAYVFRLDKDGSSTTLDDRASLVYEPTLQSANCDQAPQNLPADQWVKAQVVGGCLWEGGGDQIPLSWSALQTKYGAYTVFAYGLSQGSDADPATVAYADQASLNANVTNFEVNAQSVVGMQGMASQTWYHGGRPELGGLKVEAWVDIERTYLPANAGVTYRVRSHDRVSKVGSTLRVQSDALRLGSPDRVGVLASDGPRNSGESASVESVTPWVDVRAASSCTNPIRLWSGVTASARWADTRSSTVTFRSNPTNATSKVCLP